MANYELLEIREDGTEVRRYPNGDIRNQRGQVLELTQAFKAQQITADNAHIRHMQRKQKYLDAIEAAVMRVTEANTPAEAAGYIVGKRAKIAMTDDGRTGNEAAKIVLAAMDALQDKRTDTTHTERHEYTIDADTAEAIAQMIAIRNGIK